MSHETASNGNDYLYGSDYSEYISGYAGSDTLEGYGGNDILDGGSGNDVLWGGFGNDTLTGGPGSDAFDITSPNDGLDYISDFSSNSSFLGGGNEKIYISSVGFGIGINQYDAFTYDFNSNILYFGNTPILRTNTAEGYRSDIIIAGYGTGTLIIY